MARSFSVAIDARDNLTAKLERINRSLMKLREPAVRFNKQMALFSKLTGLHAISSGLQRIRHFAVAAFRALGQIVPVLGAITGAASVAGVYRLAMGFAQFGSNLSTTAENLGLSTARLHAMDGAARLAGVSADALDAGLQALGQGLWDAAGGRNPELVAAFKTLGISFQDANGKARSAAELMPRLADRIKSIKNPMAQAAVATTFFGSAGRQLLPFLRMGSRGMADYEAMAKRYGVVNEDAARSANRLRMVQTRLTLAVEGLGNSIAQSLEPVITPMLTAMAEWIARNREWIASGITEYVKRFANWLKSINWGRLLKGVQSMASSAASLVEGLGSITSAAKMAAWALGALFGAKILSGVLKLIASFRVLKAEVMGVGAAGASARSSLARVGGMNRQAGGLGFAMGLAMSALDRDIPMDADTLRSNPGLAGLLSPEQKALTLATPGDQSIYNMPIIGRVAHFGDWLAGRKTSVKPLPASFAGGEPRAGADIAQKQDYLARLEKHVGLPQGMLDAVWKQESSRGRHLVSGAGARGDFQFMPATARQYGVNVHDFGSSARGAAVYYRNLLNMFQGDTAKALAGYNWGQGNVLKAASKYGDDWLSHAPKETQGYVKSILGNMAKNQLGMPPAQLEAEAGDTTPTPVMPVAGPPGAPDSGRAVIVPHLPRSDTGAAASAQPVQASISVHITSDSKNTKARVTEGRNIKIASVSTQHRAMMPELSQQGF